MLTTTKNVNKWFYACKVSVNDDIKYTINHNYRWLTPGCYNPTPLKESRPEIQNERLLREEEQTNHQSQQDKVTLEKIDVDDMILYR